MTWKAHLAFGAVAAADLALAAYFSGRSPDLSALPSAALYTFGLILPDIDLKQSAVSRLLHFSLPVRHRGITHSVWAALPFLVLGAVLFAPLFWLGAGMLVHDLADWMSPAGWAAFYPLGRWRVYHDTVMVRGHFWQLYSSDVKWTEWAVVAGFAVLSCVTFAVWRIRFA